MSFSQDDDFDVTLIWLLHYFTWLTLFTERVTWKSFEMFGWSRAYLSPCLQGYHSCLCHFPYSWNTWFIITVSHVISFEVITFTHLFKARTISVFFYWDLSSSFNNSTSWVVKNMSSSKSRKRILSRPGVLAHQFYTCTLVTVILHLFTWRRLQHFRRRHHVHQNALRTHHQQNAY